MSGLCDQRFTRQMSDDRFPNPFSDMASLAMPDTMQDALRWCEYLILANGPYRSAIARILSYFITDIVITAPGGGDGVDKLGKEEKQKYKDFLDDTIGIKKVLADVALDYLTYGNSFTSLSVPFRRYLGCPRSGCGIELPLKRVFNTPSYGFTWSNFQFNAHCPRCGFNGPWNHIDRRSGEADQLKVKRWSPHDIDVLHDPYTDDTAYVWRIPDDYRTLIKQGHLFHLERASWEIIEAVKANQALLFDPGIIHHMCEQSLAGVKSRGWGISRVLTNFRQAWYVQVLQRYNEAIALDYVVPFRVLTPQPRAGAAGDVSDPVLSLGMGSFTSRLQGMLKQRRQDPATWHVLPFPVEYQALGGDATELAPKDLIELGMNTLMDAIGIPVEMYKGTMTAQVAPAAMRLFEANWSGLVDALNRFLGKLVDKIAQVMSWEPVNCKLMRVTHADDMNRQMAQLQLMMGGQISRTTGLATQGLNFAEETRLKLEEERVEAETTAQMQKEMEQAESMDQMAAPVAPAGAPPGGMPAGMSPAGAPMASMAPGGGPMPASQAFAAGQPLMPNKPTTPEEMMQMAGTLAQQIMSMPESQKDSALIQLKKEDATMHALVSSQIEEIRRQAQQQGGAQVMAQQFGKQGAAMAYRPMRGLNIRPQ